MNQQYILLTKENDLLNSLIGKSFNEKSKFEAEKILDEIHSKAQSRMIGKKALCYIVNKNEILGVGGSTLMIDKNGKIVSNLILDQFGKFLAAIFKRLDGISTVFNIKDTSGAATDLNGYGTITFNSFLSGDVGMRLQVGSGTTAPTRTDFDIETAFGTAPESTQFNAASNPVFNSGLGNFKYVASISAGGAGTIKESIVFSNMRAKNGLNISLILFRDIISPAQAFIAGQTIALEYTVQM